MTTTDRPSARHLVFWHALAVAIILALPVLKYRAPLWTLDIEEMLQIALLAGGYVASVLVTSMLGARGQRVGSVGSAVALLSAYGVVFLLILLAGFEFSRILLLAIVAVSLSLVVLAHLPAQVRGMSLALLAVAAVGATIAGVMRIVPREVEFAQPLDPTADYYETTFHRLKAKSFPNAVPTPEASAGAIAPIGDRYLLATGDGRLYVFSWTDDDEKLIVDPLPNRIELNIEGFRADLPPGLDRRRLRLTDVVVQEAGPQVRVFAAHLFWSQENACSVMRVSAIEADRDAFMSGRAESGFETIFESRPCLPFKERFTQFSMQHGGRLIVYDASTLLLTLGDHDFNGLNSDRPLAQETTNSYGKTLLIPIDGSGEPRIFTLGHRNPQGLYRDRDGTVWSTEHGPKGGDELNRLEQGGNYGWPLASYGTDYGSHEWPMNERQGEHVGFVDPFYAWLPSIGVSNVMGVDDDLFARWQGDLLVASLARRTLWRVRIREDRVVFAEPIELENRIRDLIEGHDGRIVLWTDETTIVSLTPAEADPSSPSALFDAKCGRCHPVRGTGHGAGPNLVGVVGRPVGAVPDFPYSSALSDVTGVWTPERLDRFMENPQLVVPGTFMAYEGLADAAERATILDYLTSRD